jgi:single-strand DNA-binding protein
MNINKVQLFGNLTRDPELKTFEGGNCVCKVSLATNRDWKDKEGNKQSEVSFHNLVIWGKMGETIAKYMKKGQNAYFEGYLKDSSWEGEDGIKRYKVEVVVESFQFGINKRNDSETESKDEAEDPLGDI